MPIFILSPVKVAVVSKFLGGGLASSNTDPVPPLFFGASSRPQQLAGGMERLLCLNMRGVVVFAGHMYC